MELAAVDAVMTYPRSIICAASLCTSTLSSIRVLDQAFTKTSRFLLPSQRHFNFDQATTVSERPSMLISPDAIMLAKSVNPPTK